MRHEREGDNQYTCVCVTNLGVIWLDPHNFLLWSHGRLLSMKSLVRVLPAAAYTFNMVPIYDPGGPNPHGRVWGPFPVPVRDFTPRSHYPREAGLLLGRRTPLDSLWLTRNYPDLGYHSECSIKYTVLYLELIRSLLDPFPVIPHYYWDVGRPGRVSGSIPTTASLSRTGWPVGPPRRLSE